PDRPRTQPDGPPAAAIEGTSGCPERQGSLHHRTHGSEPFRTDVAYRDRRRRRTVTETDRTAVPGRNGKVAGALLSRNQAGSRTSSARPVVHAGCGSRRCLRFCLSVAFLQMLPGTL